ncbi:MAG: hypothetical protein QNK37_30760 [Acidobacteriota bacterium]|nr:hypothetical protein [Acidobacteriota bacterium]
MVYKDDVYRANTPIDPTIKIVSLKYGLDLTEKNKVRYTYSYVIRVIGDLVHRDWQHKVGVDQIQDLSAYISEDHSLQAKKESVEGGTKISILYGKDLEMDDEFSFSFSYTVSKPFRIIGDWFREHMFLQTMVSHDCHADLVHITVTPGKRRKLLDPKPDHNIMETGDLLFPIGQVRPLEHAKVTGICKRMRVGASFILYVLGLIASGVVGAYVSKLVA